ncbi:hypothetical protein GCM10027521_43310 [Amycolatopsis cihanbeyliensis]
MPVVGGIRGVQRQAGRVDRDLPGYLAGKVPPQGVSHVVSHTPIQEDRAPIRRMRVTTRSRTAGTCGGEWRNVSDKHRQDVAARADVPVSGTAPCTCTPLR